MKKQSGANFLAKTLAQTGLTHIFFVPAIASTALVEMEKLGISRIATHSEKAAAYMADGYSRIRRSIGVCMSQSVGAANLAAGLQDAYLGSSSVLAITGKKPPMAQHRNAYQEINHTPLFTSVTKFDATVETTEQLDYLLPQAIKRALSGRPRPVHLELNGYEGDLVCRGDIEPTLEGIFENIKYPLYRNEPETGALENAVELIESSKKPIAVAGRGVFSSNAEKELKDFIEKTGIPLLTSVDAKGCLVEDHPNHHGCVGSYGRKSANKIISESDLVLFIGCSVGDQVTNLWTLPSRNTQIIQIDIDPNEIGRNYSNTLGILGDIKTVLKRMMNHEFSSSFTDWLDKVTKITAEWKSEQEKYRTSTAVPMLQERLCAEVESVLPKNAIVVADTGYSAVWSANQINLNLPAQRYLRAAGSLGWAFPASLGVQCGAPENRIVCFTGDGAFLYHLPELETAVRWNIPVVIVVNNNSRYGQSLNGANRAYGERKGKREDIFQFNSLNFAEIAEKFGCRGIRVEQPGRIAGELKEAFKHNSPVVVEVVTDGSHTAPWHNPEGQVFPVN